MFYLFINQPRLLLFDYKIVVCTTIKNAQVVKTYAFFWKAQQTTQKTQVFNTLYSVVSGKY